MIYLLVVVVFLKKLSVSASTLWSVFCVFCLYFSLFVLHTNLSSKSLQIDFFMLWNYSTVPGKDRVNFSQIRLTRSHSECVSTKSVVVVGCCHVCLSFIVFFIIMTFSFELFHIWSWQHLFIADCTLMEHFSLQWHKVAFLYNHFA